MGAKRRCRLTVEKCMGRDCSGKNSVALCDPNLANAWRKLTSTASKNTRTFW
jgi:hypothetical protein